MKDRTKKALILASLGVICVALIIGIGLRMQNPAPQDDLTDEQDQKAGDVNPVVSTDPTAPAGDPVEPMVNIQQPNASQDAAAGAGDSTGTDQTIQSDVTKPEVDEESLKDPTKTPDGQAVDGTPEPVGHDTVTQPADPAPSQGEPQAGDKNEKGQVWFPGFGWVDDDGANTENIGDSDGDLDKQVGIMGGE